MDGLDDVLLSLQMAMKGAMTCGGVNTYKIDHISKKKLRREGRLPRTLVVDPSLLLDEPPPQQSVGPSLTGSECEAPPSGSVGLSLVGPESEAPPSGSKLFVDCTGNTEGVRCVRCGDPATAAHYCFHCGHVVHGIYGASEGQ